MKKLVLLSCIPICMAMQEAFAQTVYVDALVAPAMVTYAEALKSEQNAADRNLKDIRTTQALVQRQLQIANNLHNKVLKGLQEVSGVVNNALVIKRIYETSADIVGELEEAVQTAAQHPQYAIFASRAVNTFRQRAIQLTADVSRVVAGGEVNLMDSGERQRLLQSIHRDLKLMWGSAYGISYSIKTAVRTGFWRSMNPFSTWVNRDARIMRDILKDAASS